MPKIESSRTCPNGASKKKEKMPCSRAVGSWASGVEKGKPMFAQPGARNTPRGRECAAVSRVAKRGDALTKIGCTVVAHWLPSRPFCTKIGQNGVRQNRSLRDSD